MAVRRIAATLALAGVVLLMAGGCAKQTKLGTVWKDPDYTRGRLKKVLVIGVAQKEERRRAFENQLVTVFRTRGIEAEASHTLVPDMKDLNQVRIATAIEGRGFDAAMITRLVGVDVKYTRSPGGYYAIPGGYYNSMYGFYGYAYTVVRAPDEYDSKTTASLETNLYDTETEKLIWTVQSKAFKKESLFDSIQSFAMTIMNRLAQDGLV